MSVSFGPVPTSSFSFTGLVFFHFFFQKEDHQTIGHLRLLDGEKYNYGQLESIIMSDHTVSFLLSFSLWPITRPLFYIHKQTV